MIFVGTCQIMRNNEFILKNESGTDNLKLSSYSYYKITIIIKQYQ